MDIKKTTICCMTAFMLLTAGCSKDNNPSDDSDYTQGKWGETMNGRSGELGQYPDLYSNYWEYTWYTSADVALQITGEFPHARYFSLSLYNDNTGDVIGGADDYKIVPDKGFENPFAVTTTQSSRFTVYVVPASATESQIEALDCGNVIKIPDGVEKAALCVRHYLGEDGHGNAHEFGGVELPAIKAYNINTGRQVDCPERVKSNISSLQGRVFELKSDDFKEMPFYLSPESRYYPNNSTKYLYARTRLLADEVLEFSFITPPMPSRVEEYANAPARYWSICLGSVVNTRSYLSLCDNEARVAPEGEKTNWLVVLKTNPQLEQITKDVERMNAAGEYINLFVWDSEKLDLDGKPIGNAITIMYRNILANPEWEHSIANMLPTNYFDGTNEPYQQVTNPEKQIAHVALGDYGPLGRKIKWEEYKK